MTTAAISSFGTLLKIGDGATPEVFTTIAEVRDISGIDLELDTEEVTSHSSTDGWVEKIGTLLSMGPIKFGINWVPTGATHSFTTGLVKDMVNRTRRNFQLVLPNIGATTWAFSAFVKAFSAKAPVKGELGADVTLDITGKPTLA